MLKSGIRPEYTLRYDSSTGDRLLELKDKIGSRTSYYIGNGIYRSQIKGYDLVTQILLVHSEEIERLFPIGNFQQDVVVNLFIQYCQSILSDLKDIPQNKKKNERTLIYEDGIYSGFHKLIGILTNNKAYKRLAKEQGNGIRHAIFDLRSNPQGFFDFILNITTGDTGKVITESTD